MRKDDLIYIEHILESIENIFTFTRDFDRASFLADKLVQDAVIRNLEVIGEATKNISEGYKNQHSDIPWRKMAGLRDKLIHDYMGVDLEAIWVTLETSVPRINEQLRELLGHT